MKWAKREGYLNLSNAINTGLCSFCKFSEWDGSLCSEDSYSQCLHPLGVRYEWDEDGEISMGADCWGFRPVIPFEDVANIIEVILINEWEEWMWEKLKGNRIRVATLKQKLDIPRVGKLE